VHFVPVDDDDAGAPVPLPLPVLPVPVPLPLPSEPDVEPAEAGVVSVLLEASVLLFGLLLAEGGADGGEGPDVTQLPRLSQ
jgi:hypothetical protein